MSADTVAFSPEFMAKLETKQRFIEAGAKAVSMFDPFPGPDGKYYGRLLKLSGQIDKDKGFLKVAAQFMILAFVENNSTEFAGRIIIKRFSLTDGPNSSEQDNWNRMYTDLFQAMGEETAAWPQGKQKECMTAAAARFNKQKPCCMLMIVRQKDPRYHNCNIIEQLRPEAVAQFIKPGMEQALSDKEVEQTASPPELLDETVVPDFKKQFDDASTMIINASQDQLLGMAIKTFRDINHEKLGKLPLASIKRIVLSEYCKASGQNPDQWIIPPVTDADWALPGELQPTGQIVNESRETQTITAADVGPISAASAAIGSQLSSALNIPEEDDDDEPLPKEAQIMAKVASMNRDDLKVKIFAYEPLSKFSKKQTDDDLRTICAEFMRKDPVPF